MLPNGTTIKTFSPVRISNILRFTNIMHGCCRRTLLFQVHKRRRKNTHKIPNLYIFVMLCWCVLQVSKYPIFRLMSNVGKLVGNKYHLLESLLVAIECEIIAFSSTQKSTHKSTTRLASLRFFSCQKTSIHVWFWIFKRFSNILTTRKEVNCKNTSKN